MEILKIITIVIGTTGFWKVLEILTNYLTTRKPALLKSAHLQVRSSNRLIKSWISWVNHLEMRIGELEKENLNLRDKVNSLEEKHEQLAELIEELQDQLTKENETSSPGQLKQL